VRFSCLPPRLPAPKSAGFVDTSLDTDLRDGLAGRSPADHGHARKATAPRYRAGSWDCTSAPISPRGGDLSHFLKLRMSQFCVIPADCSPWCWLWPAVHKFVDRAWRWGCRFWE
jgi:hypothetical protein